MSVTSAADFRQTQETSPCISLRLPEILRYSFTKDFKATVLVLVMESANIILVICVKCKCISAF